MDRDELEKTVRQENVRGFVKISDTAQELDGSLFAGLLGDEEGVTGNMTGNRPHESISQKQRQEWKPLEFYTEWRLRGDRYNDSYGNGFTLSGGESVQGMRIVREDADETVFEGKKGHRIRCIHEKQGDVTRCRSIFENTTGEPVYLELLSSFAVRGIKADRMHRATSFWSAEGRLLSQRINDLNMEQSWAKHGIRIEKFGQIGSMPVRKWFPFLALEDTESGHFVGLQLGCASSWQIEVMRREEELYIQGGLADRDFGQWTKCLQPGETFETPCAVIAEGNTLLEVCDRLVKAQKPRIAEPDKDLPVIFNEYCTTWGNPSFDNLERTAKRLQGTGVKYLVIDCGWYKKQDGENWFNTAGDWEPSRVLFPDGIQSAADMIRAHGLIPGIWFEFENVGSESDAFREEEHLQRRDGFPVTVGSRRFWDMRQIWVWDYLDRRLIGLLKECGFGYLKVDYNENIGAGVDGAESPGEGLRQSVEQSRAYFRHIAEELPELVIENCSSGGHRLEPSMMELVSQASFSDAHECVSIPLIAANLQRLIRPEQSQIWAVLRADADIHRVNYVLTGAFLGRLCLSGEIFDLKEEQWAQAAEAVRFYRKAAHIIRDGSTTVIRTTAVDYGDPEGYQAVLRVLEKEALLVVHTFRNGANPPIDDLLGKYRIAETFGSELDGDHRGRVFLLKS
ncbi:MAG: alpha-galactosidase [Lachnospiraceae bacterium]|nr:alpha-galactosidase [Lachnospiraceae bacterium]